MTALDPERARQCRRRRRRRPRRAWPTVRQSSSRRLSTPARQQRSRRCSPVDGGKAIDYDRQVVGGTASVYDTFDGKAVGEAQANGVIAAMKANHTYKPSSIVAQLWGGNTDQNAFWFQSGNIAVLNPLFKAHKLTKGPAKFVPELGREQRRGDLQLGSHPDARQDQGRHRSERQHRRRSRGRREGRSPQPGSAVRSGRDRAGHPVHHLRLADGHRLQVGVARGERGSCCCGRASPRARSRCRTGSA